MKESLKDLIMYTGITIALWGVFTRPDIPQYLYWVSAFSTLVVIIATIIQAYKVIVGK